jgi:hypothetical protein
MRSKAAVVVGIAVLHLAAAAAWAAPATRDKVRAVLRGHTRMPATAAEWRALGADVETYVAEAAADRTLVHGARQRALAGLGVIGSPQAGEFLRRFLAGDPAAPLVASAVLAYARGFGASDPAEAHRLAGAAMAHSHWQARRGGVRAMAALGDSTAKTALRAQDAKETHPAVKAAIKESLAAKPVR